MNATVTDAKLADKSASRPFGRLAVMSWAHFLNDGATNYLPGVLPAILHSLHLSVGFAGTIMASLLIGQTVQPLFGWLADRTGGRMFILLGVGGSALGGALVGVAPTLWGLIGVLVLIGLANSLFHPQALAAVRHLESRNIGLVMSVFLVGGELGRGIWPLLASLVVIEIGVKTLWILAIPAFLTLPLIAYKAPKLPRRHTHFAAVDWRRAGKDVGLVVAFRTMCAVLLFSLLTFVPLLWRARGGSLVGGASLLTIFLVVGIFGNVGGGHLADRFGRRAVLGVTTMLTVFMLAAFLLVTGIWQWLVLAGLGVVMFASLPVTILMGQDILPGNRSLGSGLTLGFSNGLGAIIVMLLGFLVFRLGIDGVLWVNVLLAAVTSALVPFLPGEKRQFS